MAGNPRQTRVVAAWRFKTTKSPTARASSYERLRTTAACRASRP
jgi:hypothetical protein